MPSNIIDAAVDAHLRTFDVGDDLSMKVRPSFQLGTRAYQTGFAPTTGIALDLEILTHYSLTIHENRTPRIWKNGPRNRKNKRSGTATKSLGPLLAATRERLTPELFETGRRGDRVHHTPFRS